MTEPENTDPTAAPPVDSASSETAAEDASDAQLRAWAKDNGINEVPPTGRLSSVWREYIVNAMASRLDPHAEASAEPTSSTSSDPTSSNGSNMEMTEETTQNPKTDSLVVGPATASTDGSYYDPALGRTVWQAPNTFVTSQAYTA